MSLSAPDEVVKPAASGSLSESDNTQVMNALRDILICVLELGRTMGVPLEQYVEDDRRHFASNPNWKKRFPWLP